MILVTERTSHPSVRKIKDRKETYALRKKPASGRHLTVVCLGKSAWKSSQWMKVARPPAEHPVRRACKLKSHTSIMPSITFLDCPRCLYLLWQLCKKTHWEMCKIHNWMTCLAFASPFDKSSCMTASQTRFPLKKRFVEFFATRSTRNRISSDHNIQKVLMDKFQVKESMTVTCDSLSTSPAIDAPSQYLTLTLFQL